MALILAMLAAAAVSYFVAHMFGLSNRWKATAAAVAALAGYLHGAGLVAGLVLVLARWAYIKWNDSQ